MPPNTMRWRCDANGCFNKVKRPKIEVFHDCFPRGINFGDVDMLVEIGGHLLYGEWKEPGAPVGTGQTLLHNVIANKGDTILIIEGNAETMEIARFRRKRVVNGKIDIRPYDPASLDDLKRVVRLWADWADSHKRAA